MCNIQTFLRRYQQRYEDKGRFLQFSAACAERAQRYADIDPNARGSARIAREANKDAQAMTGDWVASVCACADATAEAAADAAISAVADMAAFAEERKQQWAHLVALFEE